MKDLTIKVCTLMRVQEEFSDDISKMTVGYPGIDYI